MTDVKLTARDHAVLGYLRARAALTNGVTDVINREISEDLGYAVGHNGVATGIGDSLRRLERAGLITRSGKAGVRRGRLIQVIPCQPEERADSTT